MKDLATIAREEAMVQNTQRIAESLDRLENAQNRSSSVGYTPIFSVETKIKIAVFMAVSGVVIFPVSFFVTLVFSIVFSEVSFLSSAPLGIDSYLLVSILFGLTVAIGLSALLIKILKKF